MNIYCDHCGSEIDTLLEPEALRRDMMLAMCDLCHTLSEHDLLRLPTLHAPALVQ